MLDFFKDEKLEPGYSDEDKIVFGSLALGAVTLLIGFLIYSTFSIRVGGLLVILGILVSVLPFGIISFLKSRAISDMEKQFPVFLNDLSESKRGGMTILDSFESSRNTDYGQLDNEIAKVHDQLSWGIPFPIVMERFARRIDDSPVIQESLSIILQSYKSGGKITETIESVADNATMLREVIKEKQSALKQQLVIMYVIYFLFIGITVGVYFLMQQLLGLGNPEPGAIENIGKVLGSGQGATNFCNGEIALADPFCGIAQVFGFVPGNINDLSSVEAEKLAYGQMAYYKSVLFSMLMIQGISTAAVAGQISEGSPSGGIKHALIMIPLAFGIFMYIIRPMGF